MLLVQPCRQTPSNGCAHPVCAHAAHGIPRSHPAGSAHATPRQSAVDADPRPPTDPNAVTRRRRPTRPDGVAHTQARHARNVPGPRAAVDLAEGPPNAQPASNLERRGHAWGCRRGPTLRGTHGAAHAAPRVGRQPPWRSVSYRLTSVGQCPRICIPIRRNALERGRAVACIRVTPRGPTSDCMGGRLGADAVRRAETAMPTPVCNPSVRVC